MGYSREKRSGKKKKSGEIQDWASGRKLKRRSEKKVANKRPGGQSGSRTYKNKVLGWPKGSFGFLGNILWKNPN